MSTPTVIPVVDEGLGNTSYLVDLGDGRALAVDACRDVRGIRAVADQRGLTVAFAADTHLHADFLSGARQLAATDRARILASRAGLREFEHTALDDSDEVDLGGLRLQVLATPGHTHEHVSFVLLDDARALGVFTGGSLIVGAAARTDLVSPDRTEELARAQYASLHRLMTLPDDAMVWPTHGAGSFCSAPPGAERTSTIGRERSANPLLQAPDEDAFVAVLLGSLGTFPPYFRWLAELNRQGPQLLDGPPQLPRLDVDPVRAIMAGGGVVVDVRTVDSYAERHIAGAVSIPFRDVFATWLGWLVTPDAPVVIVRDEAQDAADIAWQAAKIGYDLSGELAGGIEAWTGAGHPTRTTRLVNPADIDGVAVLDVRQASEYAEGHVPGARHIELGELPTRATEVPREPTAVMCGHGERAMSGASLLERAGHPSVMVVRGGPQNWADAQRGRLETGG